MSNPSGTTRGRPVDYCEGGTAFAAIIVRVNADTVDLAVFPPPAAQSGAVQAVEAVPFSPTLTDRHWSFSGG